MLGTEGKKTGANTCGYRHRPFGWRQPCRRILWRRRHGTLLPFLFAEIASLNISIGADSDACRYYSKPAFYIFLPGFELIILGMYAVTRVDRMFYALGHHEQLPWESGEEHEMN